MANDSIATDTVTVRNKIRTIEELAVIAEQARAEDRTVVLCHGVFDLLHLGHVRHIEAARREGDMLIVTLTADPFVNKGPGRPIFPDHMRAEMLAALAMVDWVGINRNPSAEPVLDALQPTVYVKGSDYENPDEDITGKIASERETVERHGGRIVFTKDITFSSSSLINRYLDVYDPPIRDLLDSMRENGSSERILDLLEKVTNYRVLLVGDTIIDEYQYVEPMGKAAKENIIATRSKGNEMFAGGVIAAANHVANFCREVEVITTLGSDDSHEGLIRKSLKPNVRLNPIHVSGRPTTRKCRFIETGYMRKLFEVQTLDDSPLPQVFDDAMENLIAERAGQFDLVIVTDFGHGMIGNRIVAALTKHARFLAVNAQSNSANQGFNLITKYPRADYICIDAPEARLAMADRVSDIAVIAAETLPAAVKCRHICITHGQHGCITWTPEQGIKRIPAFTKTVIDTVGAGDAFLAVTSPLAAAGGDMTLVGFVGNAAGAMKVGIVGHRKSVEKVPLVKFVTTLLK